MAEVSTHQRKSKKGWQRKPLSTRVDLTPMVDLGFLLITFFIFTTTLAEAKATPIIVPTENTNQPPPKASDERTLQIFPTGNNRLYYCMGNDIDNMNETDYTPNGIRAVIINKQNAIAEQFGKSPLLVLIKPSPSATYGNTVDLIDEMLINNVTSYMLTEPNAKELAIIRE